jgi:hypothetical protein
MSRPIIIEGVGRLPGPLAGKMLIDNGLDVLKIEEISRPDPFSLSEDNYLGPMFNTWYEKLKQGKQSIKVSDKQEGLPCLVSELINNNNNNIILITSLKNCPLKKTVEKIKAYVIKNGGNYHHFKISSDQFESPVHDLDLAASIGLINSSSPQPLKYPVLGIQFASQIALKCLSEDLLNQESTIYFKNEIENLFNHFNYDKNITPIQGQVLGYNIYNLTDGKIVLTSLEKRTWLNFIKILKIPLEHEDRFKKIETEQERILIEALASISLKSLEKMFPIGPKRCFSIVND